MTTLRMAAAALVLLALSGCGGHDAAPTPTSPTDEHEEAPVGAREQAGINVDVVALYTESLGEPGSSGATYVDMMTANTDAIVTGLASH